MRSRCHNRVHKCWAAVRAWPIWGHPRWLIVYICAVVTVDAAAVLVATTVGLGSGRDLALFAALLACNAATTEFTRRSGENAGVTKDVHGVWELPAAILLPPVYALVMPILRQTLIQLRVRPAPVHRRVFTASAISLSYGVSWLAFHALAGIPLGYSIVLGGDKSRWIFAIAIAGLLQWAINTVLVVPAVKGSDPLASLRDMFMRRETVQNDATELCVAVLVTSSIALSWLSILFALPFVTLLQRSFRHAQLVNASRIDSKTGLLNAGTWEREAASEVVRAVRTRTPLAVALIDIDHFKAVNDSFGHLAGDRALREVARTITVFLREYDLVGRFGGEEFALLLPQAKAVDAYSIAERIRAHIGAMPIDVHDDPSAERVRLSISIGVAALGARWDSVTGGQLTDLLAAADAALYQAKQNGRDQVCVITENTTFGLREHSGDAPLEVDTPIA
jgi:diguanylate cyclase (GGDEF)-like protein